MKKNVIILLFIAILVIVGVGIYFSVYHEDSAIKEFPSDAVCSNTYLSLCYDPSNLAYGCNMEDKTCDEDEFKLATVIRVMQEYDIKIYGATWCPACKKQLEEFGKYQNYLLENGIFVYCDKEPTNPGCGDVKNIPTWKKGGQIVQIGYIDIQQIVSSTNNTNEI